MDEKRLVKTSKYLSRHLRHDPGRIGLHLAPDGWVGVDDLLEACAARNFRLTREELAEVVGRNDKRRFSFDAAGERIRASQGHSVAIDLELRRAVPAAPLFHGTSEVRLDAILREGLRRMRRHHVHLSPDPETARRVGARHGRPVVLEVAAPDMVADGFAFFRSDNGVWLTEAVPAAYLASPRAPAASPRSARSAAHGVETSVMLATKRSILPSGSPGSCQSSQRWRLSPRGIRFEYRLVLRSQA